MSTGYNIDIAGNVITTVLDQDQISADGQSASVDVRDLAGHGYILVTFGLPNNADNTIEVQLQEDPLTGGPFADVAGKTTGIRTSDVEELVLITPIDFDGVEQFLRLDYKNVAGTGVDYPVSVVAISSAHVVPSGL